jgi:quercetin dioxygenase-like cupin family protein
MNKQDFEDALQAEGYGPAIQIERPVGYEMGEHAHPFDAWVLITSGEIMIAPGLAFGNVAKTYGVGDTFKLPRGTLHFEYAGPNGVSYLAGRREDSA